MIENLLKARRRYVAMITALSGQNPVDLPLRRDLEVAIARIDDKLAATSEADESSLATGARSIPRTAGPRGSQ